MSHAVLNHCMRECWFASRHPETYKYFEGNDSLEPSPGSQPHLKTRPQLEKGRGLIVLLWTLWGSSNTLWYIWGTLSQLLRGLASLFEISLPAWDLILNLGNSFNMYSSMNICGAHSRYDGGQDNILLLSEITF